MEDTLRIKKYLVSFFAIGLSLFMVYTAGFGLFPNLIQRGIFLGAVLVLCFLTKPFSENEPGKFLWFDIVLVILSIILSVYIVYHYDRIIQDPAGATWLDRSLSVALICIVIEGARRVMGWNFPVLVLLAIGYALLGQYIPGQWGHRGFDLTYVLEHTFMTTQGIWGIVLAIGATIVAILWSSVPYYK